MIVLDGETLSLQDVVQIAEEGEAVSCDPSAVERVVQSRELVNKMIKQGAVTYGVNTGFGNFSKVRIDDNNLRRLQVNLIRSHAVGVGPAFSYLICRAIMALRLNVLLKGYSGVRPEVLHFLKQMLDHQFHPYIPEQGSLGASGDLAPLAHLALNMIGEGEAFLHERRVPALEALNAVGLKPLRLEAKDGLSLINGTQVMAAIGGLALAQAQLLTQQADIITAMSIEALRGSRTPFHYAIHAARPHRGQMQAAANLWQLLEGSPIMASHKNCDKVQDAYSLRCTPQVHGPTRDALAFATRVYEIEINSATDNPMVFVQQQSLMSGGNFHGQSLAQAFDFAAIAVAELGAISERRIERLCNGELSQLPSFLVENGGLNSGFMIAHCTAAALASENKSLCHPASVDSIPTSAAKEDHVSMGVTAARQFAQVVVNVRRILAVEWLAAAQAIDLLNQEPAILLRPAHALLREHVPPLTEDRYMAPDLEKAAQMIRKGSLWRVVSAHTKTLI